KFGNNAHRQLNSKATKKINRWVNKKLPKETGQKKASLAFISSMDTKLNKDLKSKQFSVFFRLVRKNKKDVSHPHRDFDFFQIGKKNVRKGPFEHKNFWKVWIPIVGVNYSNSLRMVRRSHKDNVKTLFIKKKNVLKPKIPQSYVASSKKRITQPLKNFSGKKGILFNEKTVHFAPSNKKTLVRISAEFNLFTA
ncbi:hypothetical protein OAJ18_01915, partial [Pelagibacteraceae bacterium]|nr:hypothetical protein [Pelagibacteraceae bacterium]